MNKRTRTLAERAATLQRSVDGPGWEAATIPLKGRPMGTAWISLRPAGTFYLPKALCVATELPHDDRVPVAMYVNRQTRHLAFMVCTPSCCLITHNIFSARSSSGGTALRGFLTEHSRLWFGVTAWDQLSWDHAINVLARIPGKRWISLEPYIETIIPRPGDFDVLDWLVIGGETGSGARLMPPNVSGLWLAPCKEAGLPVWVKQWGRNYVMGSTPREAPPEIQIILSKEAKNEDATDHS